MGTKKNGSKRRPWWIIVLMLLLGGSFLLARHFTYWNNKQLTTPVPMTGLEMDEITLQASATGLIEEEEIIEVFEDKEPKIVYGFLPYWNLSNFKLNRVVTNLSYFSLGSDAKGNIKKSEPGYVNYYRDTYNGIWNQILDAGKKNEVVISMFDADETWELLHCENCRKNLVNNIESLIKENDLAGVNIDFEYMGTVTPALRENYTKFLADLKEMMIKVDPSINLSVDIYGDGASMYNLWDMEEIGEIVDYIIIMAYDYKTRSSLVPGPVAPTLGKSDWGNDILEGLRKLLELVPAKKVILALPFYGYEWQTTTLDLNEAKTFPDSGATLTYKRLQSLLGRKEELKLTEHWDEVSLSPYITYEEDDEFFIGFYENERSLSYKMDLANGLNLGGVAIWALGYEGDTSELWHVIQSRIK